MVFTSWQFFLILPCVLLLYFIIPGSWRVCYLLAVSCLFYACFHPVYLMVILAVAGISWYGALALEKRRMQQRAAVSRPFRFYVTLCLLFLVLFKYTRFLLDNLKQLSGLFGGSFPALSFSLVMPVGISYYIFQAVSYLTDVSRGTSKAERNFLQYALYLSFFPKVISGPIERADAFLPQIRNCHTWNLWDGARVRDGLVLMMWGYFEKLVIADRLAILTGEVFGDYAGYGSVELFVAAAAFYIQLYTDFDGYTNIARGLAKAMGFTLAENFRAPFLSESIRDYWGRWHISLSMWLRDYIYIPLGGNRAGTLRKYRNLLLTFLVSGLWHGAAWNYVLWGLVHGLYEVAEDIFRPWVKRLHDHFHTKTESFSYRLFRRAKCWLLVCLAYIFFKVPTAADGLRYLKRMVTKWNPWVLFDGSLYTLGITEKYMHVLFLALLLLFAVDRVKEKRHMEADVWLAEQCVWFRWLVMLGGIMAVIVFGAYGPAYDAENFIYFNF